MEIRKETPQPKKRSGFDYEGFVAAAMAARGEWVATDYEGKTSPQSAVYNHVGGHFADVSLRGGVIYLRIRAEGEL